MSFNLVSIVKKMEGREIRVGRIGTKEFFQGVLEYCDALGNLHILSEDGSIIIQRAGWGFITTDFMQPKRKDD